jgi:hypothetical protein
MRWAVWRAIVWAITIAIQVQPDFSGRWVLVSSTPSSTDAPHVLIVEQPVTRTDVRGKPIAPTYLRISIRRERASGVTNETQEIGVSGGVVGALVAATGQARGTSSRFETAWRLNMLMFLTATSGPDGPHTGGWSERSEIWSLDGVGQLRVEILSESYDQPRQASVSVYRRE